MEIAEEKYEAATGWKHFTTGEMKKKRQIDDTINSMKMKLQRFYNKSPENK